MGLHPTLLLRQLTDRLTVVLHGGVETHRDGLEVVQASGVRVVTGHVTGVVSDDADEIVAVMLADHEPIPADVVVVGPRFRVRAEPFAALGLQPVPHPTGVGDHLETDALGQTSVPGLYAAGNVTDPSQQVLQAAADGSRVGAMISFSLAEEDAKAAARPSGNAIDWDHRYSGDRMWSGNPNGTLVHEVTGVAPGRALDVGAGEGGDAIWLAEQGWKVTANDISQRALDRVDAAARARGVAVACQLADANALDAFEREAFDLVSAQYASIPRTPDGRGVRNLIDAVAPGGTLLVVSHDLEPMRAPIDTTTQSQAFDPDAYVRVEDVKAALEGTGGWDIEVDEKRPRPPGSATASHHVDDIVLRARRSIERSASGKGSR
jgi:SAM-dependent methyltransferase